MYNFKNYKPNIYQTKKDVVMINANKFSAEASSNYGLRRMVSKKLAKSELTYDLFGPDWNCNKFKEFGRIAIRYGRDAVELRMGAYIRCGISR